MLVTPLRDGMNLVAKEYVAARSDDDGVLVLSEFAGAADELTDAVLVNPHDEKALRDAIVSAVEMHRYERRERLRRFREVVEGSDVQGLRRNGSSPLQGPTASTSTSRIVIHERAGDRALRRTTERRRGSPGHTRAAMCFVGLDVMHVLAPIVAMPTPSGSCPACSRRSPTGGTRPPVAIVSGRTVADLARFDFPGHAR